MSRPSKNCEICGEEFERRPSFSRAQWQASRYCGKACSGIANKRLLAARRPPLKEAFESKFQRGEGCWEWQGTIEGYGYGVLDHDGRRYRAHVLALSYDGRPVPPGGMACHTCDNPRCVRPSHLYPGTAKDNLRDASVRGRLRVGEQNSRSKLTEDTVRQMRTEAGSFTDIAQKYGVSRPAATRAIRGSTWRHVR